MEAGAYGRLESVIPPITVPAWMCMATSQDPGSLGRLRLSQPGRPLVRRPGDRNSRSIAEPAIWDQLAREGKRSVIVGVPPGYPPRTVNGLSRRLLPDPRYRQERLHVIRPSCPTRSAQLVGHYPVDVKGFRTDDKAWLRDEIFAMSRNALRGRAALPQDQGVGLLPVRRDRAGPHAPRVLEVPRPAHVLHEPDSPFRETIHDYYRQLDERSAGARAA